MAENTKIEWAIHTANLVHGCTAVHAGCDNCYACALTERYGRHLWGNDAPRMEIKNVWEKLQRYQHLADQADEVHTVFVGSMMDIFEKPMPVVNAQGVLQSYKTDFLRNRLFTEILLNYYPNLMFLLLTKRPSNINKYIPPKWLDHPPANVMFGTSPCNQETADTLINQLVKVNGKRFLSVEPQLEDLTLLPWLQTGEIDWVIQGGESGHHRRPFDLAWGRKLKAECEQTNIPFFFKQVDKVIQIPDDLLVRQFPSFN